MLSLLLAGAFMLQPSVSFGNGPQTGRKDSADQLQSIRLNLASHSGAPLVLEFSLEDPDGLVREVVFDFDSDGKAEKVVEIPGEPGDEGSGEEPGKEPSEDESDSEGLLYKGIPYDVPGVYHPVVELHTELGSVRRELEVAFTDFVWGRDNYRFANDGEYENKLDFVSTTVLEWAGERFGPIDQEQRMLLLYFMYSMYKGSIGRCYGFTGGQVHYLNGGEFPSPYTSVYELAESDQRVTRSMDWVQNDIVFSSFLSGRIDVIQRQNGEKLKQELRTARESIAEGRPIIIGYISNRMHHSMVVYGYFHDPAAQELTLVTANNWERNQSDNTFSEDAENVKVELSREPPRMRWYDVSKKRTRFPQKIFTVTLDDTDLLVREQLMELLARMEDDIRSLGKRVVMVEAVKTAYIENEEGKKRGYARPEYLYQIYDADLKKIDYNYLFKIPAEGEFVLKLADPEYNKQLDRTKQVNVFGIFPTENGLKTTAFWGIDLAEEGETRYRVGEQGLHRVE